MSPTFLAIVLLIGIGIIAEILIFVPNGALNVLIKIGGKVLLATIGLILAAATLVSLIDGCLGNMLK